MPFISLTRSIRSHVGGCKLRIIVICSYPEFFSSESESLSDSDVPNNNNTISSFDSEKI